jgi:3-hydroxyisobutyrate dehydrogenase-like beta-hydroxyacid dehydrogenase
MKTIGFIGLGTMGMPMANILLKKGYPLTVYNRTAEKTEVLDKLGAEVAVTPAAAAKEVDVLFTNVSDDQALLDIFYGANGILEGIHPGLTVIDCSTVAAETSQAIYTELQNHYADFLDAPVTGSVQGAETGTLVFMVGGNEEVFDEHQDLFETLGKQSLYMGRSGSGSQAKLAHNAMVGIHAAALTEGLALAAKSGLDPEKFLQIVLAGGANSKQAELRGAKIIARDFSNQFSFDLMLKDLRLASKLAGQLQIPSPMLNAATTLFQMGASKGLGSEDLCSVIQCYEDWIGQIVTKKPDEPKSPLVSFEDKQNRRINNRVQLNIKLQLSVYQWEQEGSFSGQNIAGSLLDLSESGLQIASLFPLATDMFIVIHFPKAADLPPITGKVIRIEPVDEGYRYGCMLSGLAPYIRIKLEQFIQQHRDAQAQN